MGYWGIIEIEEPVHHRAFAHAFSLPGDPFLPLPTLPLANPAYHWGISCYHLTPLLCSHHATCLVRIIPIIIAHDLLSPYYVPDSAKSPIYMLYHLILPTLGEITVALFF